MQSPTPSAVPVHLVLRGRPPAPARLTLRYRRLRWRLLGAGAVLAACVAATGWAARVAPAAPWSTLVLAAGLVLAAHVWRGRHHVGSFMGVCPGCGGQLALRPGSRIRLPRPVFCTACGATPALRPRAPDPRAAAPPEVLRHQRADCTGEWLSEWRWDESFVVCHRCGVRHPAGAALRRMAAEENQRGALLARLADEGRYL